IQRCTNPNDNGYKNYGGRGISLCDKWLTFSGFFEDMGHRPSNKHSIERRDNSGNYCLENCYWATRRVQSRNKRNNRIIRANGIEMCLEDWAKQTKITHSAIIYRINAGWPEDLAVTTPKNVTLKRVLGLLKCKKSR